MPVQCDTLPFFIRFDWHTLVCYLVPAAEKEYSSNGHPSIGGVKISNDPDTIPIHRISSQDQDASHQHHRTLFCIPSVPDKQDGKPLVEQMLRCRIKFQSMRPPMECERILLPV